MKNESGWVIEKNGLCFGISCSKPTWVTFPDENSVRFRRKADAELILAVLQNGNAGFDSSVITEHLWNEAPDSVSDLDKAAKRWLRAKREQVLREDLRGELLAEVRRQEQSVEDAIAFELEEAERVAGKAEAKCSG